MPTFATLLNIVLEVLARAIMQEKGKKKKKRHPNQKEEVKLSLFVDDMILDRENPKDSPKNC